MVRTRGSVMCMCASTTAASTDGSAAAASLNQGARKASATVDTSTALHACFMSYTKPSTNSREPWMPCSRAKREPTGWPEPARSTFEVRYVPLREATNPEASRSRVTVSLW
eukprot:scaffold9532_cov143-Isochrysis_galbana.AAC.3